MRKNFPNMSNKQKTAILTNWALFKISYHGQHIRGALPDHLHSRFDKFINGLIKTLRKEYVK